MARTLVFGNLKGGTGKSTLAVNVACALHAGGAATALIDTDPQGTASTWLARQDDGPNVIAAPIDDGAWLDTLQQQRRVQDIVIVDLPPAHPAAIAARTSGVAIVAILLVAIVPPVSDAGHRAPCTF